MDTIRFGLTKEQCSVQVHIEIQGQVIAGAAAVATLLNERGNKKLASIIFRSGPFGRVGYRWVTTHRNSWLIKGATRLLERKSQKI